MPVVQQHLFLNAESSLDPGANGTWVMMTTIYAMLDQAQKISTGTMQVSPQGLDNLWLSAIQFLSRHSKLNAYIPGAI